MAIGAVLVGVWIVGATSGLQIFAWGLADVLLASGQPPPSWAWLAVAWGNAAIVAAPAGLIWGLARAFTPRQKEVQAAARAWTFAALAAGVLGSVRATPVTQHEILLLLTALVAAGIGLALRLLSRRGPRSTARRGLVGFATAAGLLVLLPWLWAGALGGLTETLLAVVAAAAFGWLAANVLDGAFFAAFGRSRPHQVMVGGLTAGVALCPLGAALGGPGVNLAEMLLLPALGFAAAALATSVAPGLVRPAPLVALLGLSALGPLAFVDPEETSILLGFSDVGMWTFVATALSVPVALMAGTAYGLALSPRRAIKAWLAGGLALLVALAAFGVYGLAGRPGLYGDRLFVILADQADLAGVDAIADRPERLRETYKRLTEHAERTQAPLRESLDGWGLTYTPYYLVNAILVDGGPIVRQWLAGRSDVDRVLLDQRLRPLPVGTATERGAASAPDGTPLWNIEMLEAERAWELGVTGSGIVIGTSDSGVDGSHPALRDGYRGGDDSWYDPWNGTLTPTDHGGHGTHTLGTALGTNGIGVAPQAQWIGCVNLDRNLGSPSRYLDCLQFMLAPFAPGANPMRDGHPDRAPHVLTNSWGCPSIEGCDTGALLAATAALRAAGIFFVAAAGNSGPQCSTVDDPPAPYPDVFTVGAVDRTRQVTDFSSRGPAYDGRAKPDVVAPGNDVLSAFPGGTYESLPGTSMAAPHVAGVVALMWSANPALIGDIDATAEILRETATQATPSYAEGQGSGACGGDANITGAGLVNAYEAVLATRSQ